MAEEFYSFEKALRELHKTEEELKKLVSEGEIRAFRDDNSMKFKKEDIERFRGVGRSGSDLPTMEAPTGELTEELFGDDAGSGDDVGMVTQQISDSSFLEEDEADTAAPVRSKGGRKPPPAPAAARAGRTSSVAIQQRQAMRRIAEGGEESEGTGLRIAMVLSALVMFYAIIVAFNAAEVKKTGMTKGWSDFVHNTFLK